MNCPECKKKMIYSREEKDYYCENCEKTLKEIEEPEIEERDEDGDVRVIVALIRYRLAD